MNIPTIEELDRIGAEASGMVPGNMAPWFMEYLTAIRDAVVAACRPQLRPIAEMPAEVPVGCVRMFGGLYAGEKWVFDPTRQPPDTHCIDIALPDPTYHADFERAFAESNLDDKDKDAAFKLWRGGVR